MFKLKIGTISIVASMMILAWVAVATRYYGPTEPMSPVEVNLAMVQVEQMFREVGVPDGYGGADMPRLLAELRHFAETDDGKPFYMLNLMRWRDEAMFRPDQKGVTDMTASDADASYRQQLSAELAKNASHTAYLSSAQTSALNYGINSAEASAWEEVGIYRYSSRQDFFNMIGSDSYRAIVVYKFASMGHIELLPTQPHGLLLNPMPDMPVLLGFILIIAYLVFLLAWTSRQ